MKSQKNKTMKRSSQPQLFKMLKVLINIDELYEIDKI